MKTVIETFDDMFGASQNNSGYQGDDWEGVSETQSDDLRETGAQQDEGWENRTEDDGEHANLDQTREVVDEESSGDEGIATFIKTLSHPRGRKPGELKRRPDGGYLIEEGGKYQWRMNDQEPWRKMSPISLRHS